MPLHGSGRDRAQNFCSRLRRRSKRSSPWKHSHGDRNETLTHWCIAACGLSRWQPFRAHFPGSEQVMGFGMRVLTASRPWRLSAKLLILSSVVTVIGFSAVCTSVMLDVRHGEEELARQTLENLATGIDADISRNVELYDLSLRNVASNLVMPALKDVSKEIRHLILFDHAA